MGPKVTHGQGSKVTERFARWRSKVVQFTRKGGKQSVAVRPCRDCGQVVSTTAKACPSCGARQVPRTSVATWVVGGAFALAIGLAITSQGDDAGRQAPAQRADQAQAELEFQQVLAAARWLRGTMKKPEAFELIAAHRTADGSAVCLQYRGRDSYNDARTDVRVITDTVNSGQAADWNRYCVDQPLVDFSHVRAVL
jgi:hypothetical protein